MKNYYGLKLARGLYLGLAAVVAIFTVGAVGVVLAEGNFNLANIDWERVTLYLVVGGLFSFTSYVLAQLIDVVLSHYGHNVHLDKELDTIREATTRMYKMQIWQVDVLKAMNSDSTKANAMTATLMERAKRLIQEQDG